LHVEPGWQPVLRRRFCPADRLIADFPAFSGSMDWKKLPNLRFYLIAKIRFQGKVNR
jgi:hypothetical protein